MFFGCFNFSWLYLWNCLVLSSLNVSIQTWPTEAELADADRNHKEKKMKKKRLPKGVSAYQVEPHHHF